MKRLLLVSFAGFLLNIHVFAQWDDYDSDDYYNDPQEDSVSGTTNSVSSETDASGATNITVKNMGTEDQAEQKITLPNNQPIYLYFYNSVQNPVPPEPAAQAAQPAGTMAEQPPPEFLYTPARPAGEKYDPPPKPPVEYRYIPPPPVEYRYIPPPPVEYRYIPPPPVEYVYIPAPAVEPIYEPPPVQIRVIPCLPNPDSRRVYRIQVGSYAVHNTADLMARRLTDAGLQAGIEYYNSLKRVFVSGVSAADAVTVVRTLEFLGFQEVWIRE